MVDHVLLLEMAISSQLHVLHLVLDLPSGIQESSQNVRVESLKPLLNSLPSAEVSGTGKN